MLPEIEAALASGEVGEERMAFLGLLLQCASEGQGETEPDSVGDLGAALGLLEHKAVRFRLSRLAALSWRLAIDPLSSGGSLACTPLLRQRSYVDTDCAGARIVRRKDRHRAGPMAAQRTVRGSTTVLLSIVSPEELQAGLRLRDLPVGTAIVHGSEERVVGRIAPGREVPDSGSASAERS